MHHHVEISFAARTGGGDNDGYADNLAFVLQAPAGEVPEPGMASLLLLSLGALGWARRRAR